MHEDDFAWESGYSELFEAMKDPSSALAIYNVDGINDETARAIVEDAMDVERLGLESTQGTPATHWRLTIDHAALPLHVTPEERDELASLGMRAIDLWLDDQRRPVRQRTTLDMASLGLPSGEMAVDVTYSYDEQVSIQAPLGYVDGPPPAL
jgi:hypothetical protein